MDALHTPDERFTGLEGWPYEPRSVTVGGGLRMSYVDEGPSSAPSVLLAHGEPTWGYLYRKMIPTLLGAGHRVIAPDLVGFGRSDKTLAPFLAWYEYSQTRDPLLPSECVGGDSPLNQTRHRLTAREREGYDAPFPDESYRAGARQFPLLVPLGTQDSASEMLREAWNGLERFDKPFVTVFAEHENITRVFEPLMQQRIPGARGLKHITVTNSGHFLQEHQPQLLVDVILQLGNPLANASASQR